MVDHRDPLLPSGEQIERAWAEYNEQLDLITNPTQPTAMSTPSPLARSLEQKGILAALQLLLREAPAPTRDTASSLLNEYEEAYEHLPDSVDTSGDFEHVWADIDVEDWPEPDPDKATGYVLRYYQTGIGRDLVGRYLVAQVGTGYVSRPGDPVQDWDWDGDDEVAYLPGSEDGYYDEGEAATFLREVWDRSSAFFLGWARYHLDVAHRLLAGHAGYAADPLAGCVRYDGRATATVDEALNDALGHIGYLYSGAFSPLPPPEEPEKAERRVEHAGRVFVVEYEEDEDGEGSFRFVEEAPAPRHLDPYISDHYGADSIEDAVAQATGLMDTIFGGDEKA